MPRCAAAPPDLPHSTHLGPCKAPDLDLATLLQRTTQFPCNFVHDIVAAGWMQASSSDVAALDFLQPRHMDLDALTRQLPKGSAEAAAQVWTPPP